MLRYLRNHDAISEAEQAILAQKRVLVVGCGGLGGYVIECLARIGVGYLRVVDGDVFDETNLNRQLLSSNMNLGRPKTLAAQQRVMAVNPLVEVEAFQSLLTAENAVQLLEGCDVAVDALDNVPIACCCSRQPKPLAFHLFTVRSLAGLGRCVSCSQVRNCSIHFIQLQRIIRVKSRKRAPYLSLLPLPHPGRLPRR